MKVLILHQHFKVPQRGGAVRSYYLAKALVDQGIQTVVITAHNEALYRKEMIEGIEVHYLPVPYDNRFGFNKRVNSFFKFVVQSVKYAGLHRDVDVCYAISVPLTTGLVAMWLKIRYGIPFIFEVGDLWPDAPIAMEFIRNRFLQRTLYALEAAIYQQALSVVALSSSIKTIVESKVKGKAVHVLPNMADTGFFIPEEKRPSLEEKFNVRGKFVVAYIGAIGVANGLEFYLACADESQKAGLPIHFLLCGDGAMLEVHQNSAKRLELSNLTFLPFRNRDGVREIMNVTDAVFICYQPIKILETGSPNKYFDGLASGKLVIINFGGWIKDEVEQERCGVSIDQRHPKNFVEKIKPFLDDRKLLKQYQQAARRLAEQKYSREMLAKQFCGIVEGR
ncbi:MAG: glycosyltransferase family 4 protein [Cyclobacteriaceae bacterium]